MMRGLATLLLTAAIVFATPGFALEVSSAIMRVTPLPPNTENAAAKIRMRLTPRGANWVRNEVQRLHENRTTPAQVESDATYAGGGMLHQGGFASGGDIAELAFVVLMEATKSADDDLQSIMAETKAQTNAKNQLRNQANTINRDVANNAAQADKGRLDSMNEMSEMTSMRLQMAMDRRSKFVEALSNIMKKMSDTDNSIIQNMK